MEDDVGPSEPITLEALSKLLTAAREGDRKADKVLMFPYRYGLTRDMATGEFRAYTEQEIREARDRMGLP